MDEQLLTPSQPPPCQGEEQTLDSIDRALINHLQYGIEVEAAPFADVAQSLGLSEDEVVARVQHLLDEGWLTRFGPMYHAEEMGGALTLAAMSIPPDEFERVAEQVNALPEVAHNYERAHALNMWFVLATEQPEQIAQVIARIEAETGYPVWNMPKQEEFYVGLYFAL